MNLFSLFIIFLAAVSSVLLVDFVFNPLGLGPEPDNFLDDRFFQQPEKDLSSLALLIDGEEGFNAALKAIESAKKTITVQTFIWKDDETGRQVVAKLEEAADRGVKVSVNKDMLGSFFELGDLFKGKPSPVFGDSDFRGHNNITIKTNLLADTDHSKYYIVDGRIAVFGGMNIADEYRTKWHDYMVKIDHPTWVGAFEKKTLQSARWPSDAPYALATNDRYATEIRTALIQIIDRAKKNIILEHAYFSDGKIIEAVKRSLRRGVQTHVILPEEPDTHLYANMATINQLLGSPGSDNLKVLLYPGMTHAKVALVDGVIAAVGSANLTPRSMLTSREATLFVHGSSDSPFISRLKTRLEEDIRKSRRVTTPYKLTAWEKAGAALGKYIW